MSEKGDGEAGEDGACERCDGGGETRKNMRSYMSSKSEPVKTPVRSSR